MFEALLQAFSMFGSTDVILMLLLGAGVLGFFFGILPGFGATNTMALVLPLTYAMSPMAAIALFTAILSANAFGGSIPGILINTPGSPPNMCGTFDGHPMAQRGEEKRAIYIAAICNFASTVFGALLLFLSIPIMRALVLAMGTPDMFWMFFFGITMVSFASKGNTAKGIAGGTLGILLAMMGRSYVFPYPRFTLGTRFLYDGIELIPFVMGVFAITAAMLYAARPTICYLDESTPRKSSLEQAKQALRDVIKYKWVVVRGGFIGVFVGIIPGVGGQMASFLSYSTAAQLSKHPEEFGKGSPEGLIAAESANDAKDGGAIIPTVSFGIPGSPDTAILMVAFLIHGVPVGPRFFDDHLHVLLFICLALVIGQVIMTIVGVTLTPIVTHIVNIKTYYIVPVITVFCFFGTYAYRENIWDFLILVIAALLAYGMALFNFPLISLALGFLLGADWERYFYRTTSLSEGSFDAFFQSPISIVIICIIVGVFLLDFLYLSRRANKPDPRDGCTADEGNASEKAEEIKEEKEFDEKFYRTMKIAEIGFLALLFLIGSGFLFEAVTAVEGDGATFPIWISLALMVITGVSILTKVSATANLFILKLLRKDVSEVEISSKAVPGHFKHHFKVIAWVTITAVMIFFFGFAVSVPIMVFVYIFLHDRAGWLKAVAISIALFVIVMFVLDPIVPASIWPGAIPSIIRGYIGGGIVPIF